MKSIVKYQLPNGKVPFDDWLNTLDKSCKAEVLIRIERIKYGLLGKYRNLANGISEIKFHNGNPVTAADVKSSLETCADSSSGSALIPAFSNITSIETPDDKTVVITLAEADADFLSYVAGVKAAIVPADNTDPDADPIGTGPYKYVSRSVQENIKLESFADYWGGKPDIDQVTFKVCADTDSVVTSLNSGSIDMMAHLTTTQAEQLGDDFNVVEGTMNLVQGLYLNNSFEPFQNELVRQALCYGIDRDEIINMVSDGKGVKVGSSMFPNFRKYFEPELADKYSYDVDKAKELLAEAGYSDGFTFTITVPSNYPQHVDTAQIIAEQLKKIGVTAEINQVEWNTWLDDAYGNRNFEATLVGVDASYFAASAMLSRFNSDAPCSNNVNQHDDFGISTTSYNASAKYHIFHLDRSIQGKYDKQYLSKLFYAVINTI